jgi:hypothetical protein
MKRFIYVTMAMIAVTFCGQAWLGTVATAQAATVTDTLELKAVIKEFCEGNPKFFENFTDPLKTDAFLTITRDVNGDDDVTDIQAKINDTGSDDIEAITMKGLAFFSNKSHSLAQFVLSGVNPGNDDHFLTVKGQATFNKLGDLTKATGTFVTQGTGTYTIDKKTGEQSLPVECFSSGTIVTGKKILVP